MSSGNSNFEINPLDGAGQHDIQNNESCNFNHYICVYQ